MQFSVKLCCLMAVGFVTFRIAFLQDDYLACMRTSHEFHEATKSFEEIRAVDDSARTRAADDVLKKYMAYRQAELKWDSDLKWLRQ